MIRQQYYFFIAGVFFLAAGLPLYLKLVKPNGLFGFKVKLTATDVALWYPVNKRAGGTLAAGGLLVLFCTFGLVHLPGLSRDYYTLLCSLAVAGSIIAAGTRGNALLRRIVNERY